MATFEPTRLMVARRRRGLTQRELADVCSKTSQYISMLERGEWVPSQEMVNEIARALDFPSSFFFKEPIELTDDDALSFRARRSMKSETRDVGLGTGDIAANIISVDLEERFRLPNPDIPDYSSRSPEEAADQLRADWKLGYEPIQNMVHLLESKGVRMYWLHHESPSLDAYCFWKDEKPFIVLNSLKDAGERARFDAAHELGHLVLHRCEKSLDTKKIEDEANRFASAFLMPAETFQLEFPDRPELGHLYRLKPRWKVSVSAMIMRGADLNVFSEWQKRQALTQLSAMGMRTKEKLRIPREQSKLHKMVFEALAKSNISSVAYSEMLNLSFNDVGELMPVAQEFVSKTGSTTSPNEPKEIRRGHLRVIPGGKSRKV